MLRYYELNQVLGLMTAGLAALTISTSCDFDDLEKLNEPPT